MMTMSKRVKVTTRRIDDLMETGLIAGCFARLVLQYFDSHSVSQPPSILIIYMPAAQILSSLIIEQRGCDTQPQRQAAPNGMLDV